MSLLYPVNSTCQEWYAPVPVPTSLLLTIWMVYVYARTEDQSQPKPQDIPGQASCCMGSEKWCLTVSNVSHSSQGGVRLALLTTNHPTQHHPPPQHPISNLLWFKVIRTDILTGPLEDGLGRPFWKGISFRSFFSFNLLKHIIFDTQLNGNISGDDSTVLYLSEI